MKAGMRPVRTTSSQQPTNLGDVYFGGGAVNEL